MTDALPWALVALVAVAVLALLAWRRWGGPGAVSVGLGAVALWLAAAVGLVRIGRRPRGRAPSTPPDLHRAREAAEEARRAERAREAAVRLEADIDAAGDAEALVEHLTRRSRGES